MNFESREAIPPNPERERTEAFLRRVDAVETATQVRWESFRGEHGLGEREMSPRFLGLEEMLRRVHGGH